MKTNFNSHRPNRLVSPAQRMTPPRPPMARRAHRHSVLRQVDPAVAFNDLLPDLCESGIDFAWAHCPFHDDNNPSFCVNLRTGWYRCFSTSCGHAGTNIVSFVSAMLGLSHADARRYTEARYGR